MSFAITPAAFPAFGQDPCPTHIGIATSSQKKSPAQNKLIFALNHRACCIECRKAFGTRFLFQSQVGKDMCWIIKQKLDFICEIETLFYLEILYWFTLFWLGNSLVFGIMIAIKGTIGPVLSLFLLARTRTKFGFFLPILKMLQANILISICIQQSGLAKCKTRPLCANT